MVKEKIHPQYYPKAKVHCSCGNSFEVGSTKESIEVEVCSGCHSFYTGKDRVADSVGQIQKFKKRAAKKEQMKKK